MLDPVHVAAPVKAMHWGDLTGEPLEADEVVKASRLEIEYLNQVRVASRGRKVTPVRTPAMLEAPDGSASKGGRHAPIPLGVEGDQDVRRRTAFRHHTTHRIGEVPSSKFRQRQQQRSRMPTYQGILLCRRHTQYLCPTTILAFGGAPVRHARQAGQSYVWHT